MFRSFKLQCLYFHKPYLHILTACDLLKLALILEQPFNIIVDDTVDPETRSCGMMALREHDKLCHKRNTHQLWINFGGHSSRIINVRTIDQPKPANHNSSIYTIHNSNIRFMYTALIMLPTLGAYFI